MLLFSLAAPMWLSLRLDKGGKGALLLCSFKLSSYWASAPRVLPAICGLMTQPWWSSCTGRPGLYGQLQQPLCWGEASSATKAQFESTPAAALQASEETLSCAATAAIAGWRSTGPQGLLPCGLHSNCFTYSMTCHDVVCDWAFLPNSSSRN